MNDISLKDKENNASTVVSIADLDRDGIPDVLEMSKSKINLTTYSGPITSDLCKIECNGVEKASFKYTFADNAAVHQPYFYNPASGNRCNLSSIKLVSQMDIPNGLGKMGTACTNMSSSFNYYRGSYLNDERGFLGFEKSEELCVSNGNTTKTINNQLATVSVSQNRIKAIDTDDGYHPDRHVVVLLTERNDTSFLDNSIVNVKIDYDEYNRISKEITTYDDHSYLITEYKDYSTYDLPQIVTETKKHFQDSKPFVQETKFTYDEHSNLTVKTEYSNTATPVITYNEYDDKGLLKSKKTEATGVESVSESYTYIQEPSRYKITLKEALSTTCSYYDYFTGNLLERSVTHNGMDPQTTRYYYNGLGEKIRIVHPNNTEWNISYRWSASKKAYLESTENETGKPAVEKWYDILGREIYNSTRQGDVTVENAIIYNGLGQKLSEINCQPQKSSWTNYSYCVDGRLNSISTDISGLAGGDFWSGFASGGLGSLAGSAFMMYGGSFAASNIGTYAFSGLAGGIGSKLTGGKFLDGMVIGLMNAGLNHVQSSIGEAGARYFANRKAAYRYMWRESFAYGIPIKENSGWELENNAVIVLPNNENTRRASKNDFLPAGPSDDGNYYVRFKKTTYKVYSHVHTHPNSGGLGLSEADATMNLKIGKPLHIIYERNVYYVKYNGSVINDTYPYNPQKWFYKKLNYKF